MSLWTTLRTAVDLASRVEEIEHRVSAVESEWTDVLDLLKKREERQRKRDSRAVKGMIEPHQDTDFEASKSASVDDRKAQLRAVARERGLIGARRVNQ